jgi:hypothetical protein
MMMLALWLSINWMLYLVVCLVMGICYWFIKSSLEMAKKIYEIFLMIHYDSWNAYLLEQEMEEVNNYL